MGLLQTSWPGLAVALGCAVIVTTRAVIVSAPQPLRAATPRERANVAETIAAQEADWANETARNFPADSWSQRDDFSGKEFRKVQQLSKDKHVRIEDILRAVDDDIHHQRPPRTVNGTVLPPVDRHANAISCKPRPFYD